MKSSFFAYSLLIVVLVAVVLSPSPSSAQAPLDAQTLLGLVSNVMSTLPPCSIPCLQQLPGFSTSLTVAFLTAMCTNPVGF
ncbi:hypothetical protein BC829DRAFT_409190 [Chytridium lagenaria]|nr:hypothetical protein BC829DRAFT_409190 [Chytridium lagenaria]